MLIEGIVSYLSANSDDCYELLTQGQFDEHKNYSMKDVDR